MAPVRQQVLDSLRRAIFEGHFRPGDRLVERELCALTGVGRSSIREALRQLEAEGLIETRPGRGPVVRTITAAEAEDLYQVRALLEGLAGRLFAVRATDREIGALRNAVDMLEVAFQSGGPDSAMFAKDHFYQVLLSGCRNQAAYSLLQSLHNRITVLRATTMGQPDRPAETVAELRRILDAVERRDPVAAWQACTEHVERAAAVAVRALGWSPSDRQKARPDSPVQGWLRELNALPTTDGGSDG